MKHSGQRLSGSVCRCLDCAKARNDKLLNYAKSTFPTGWAAVQRLEIEADDLETQANDLRAEAASLRDGILNSARAALI